MPTTARRAALGALIGAAPGVALTVASLSVISGEAQLTAAVGGLLLALAGAAAGAMLAPRAGDHTARVVLGTVAGALPGVAAFFAPGASRLAPLLLLAGAVAGGRLAARLAA